MVKLIDSEIKWIGSIPEAWQIIRLKYIAELNGRIGWQGLTSDEYTDEGPFLITGTDFLEGRIDWNSCVHIIKKRWYEADKIQIENGDLLITKDGTVGKVAIVEDLEGLASLNSGVLKISLARQCSTRFLYYVLQSEVFWMWFNYTSSGNSTILHLYEKDFYNFTFALPSLAEQNAIADFLDSEVEKINNIIMKTEKQREILNKYLSSYTIEILKFGIVKDKAIKKESGIDILGEISSEFSLKRLKYLCEITTGNQDTQDSVAEGKYNFYVRSPHVEKSNRYDFEGESILMAGDGVGAGRIFHHAEGKYGVHQRVYILHNFKEIYGRYLYYYMKSFFSMEIEKGSAKSTVDSVRMPMLKNFYIVKPRIEEQKEISDHLDLKSQLIEKLIEKKNVQLKLLELYKSSLVYEYVTGKKRVGGFNNGN